jgi:predicted cupin superfamily sugar epimerase
MMAVMDRVQELIAHLSLAPHPERGFYVESYRSPLAFEVPAPHAGRRAASTAIYFLVTAVQPATFLHRRLSDELFHLYEGGPLEVLLLPGEGRGQGRVARLGLDLAAGERPQLAIPAGHWFGTELVAGASHALIGCTVAPGFDFGDFELARGPELAAAHPAFADRIARMTRPPASR